MLETTFTFKSLSSEIDNETKSQGEEMKREVGGAVLERAAALLARVDENNGPSDELS